MFIHTGAGPLVALHSQWGADGAPGCPLTSVKPEVFKKEERTFRETDVLEDREEVLSFSWCHRLEETSNIFSPGRLTWTGPTLSNPVQPGPGWSGHTFSP